MSRATSGERKWEKRKLTLVTHESNFSKHYLSEQIKTKH